jgi:cytochrome c-type biogenesis protein
MTAASIGLLAAFAAGVVSFLSPCVLPLVPAYVSHIAGEGVARGSMPAARARLASLAVSAPFVAGFSAVFVAFGASASALGQLLQRHRFEANLVAGGLVIAMGLFMLGLLRWLPWLQRDLRVHLGMPRAGPVASFGLGAAFAFGWTPCIGPILAAILAVTAVENSGAGIALLGAYSLGLGVPFLLTSLFVDRAAAALGRLRRLGAAVRIGGGLVLVAMGVAMITGRLSLFSLWLLDTFPFLGTIG